MRYFITNNNDEQSLKTKKYIIDFLSKHSGFIFDENQPEIIISLGGDGRFLKTVNQYNDKLNTFAIVGISTGKLGFLCDYKINDIDQFLNDFISHTPRYETRKMIEVYYNKKKHLYLNEFRIEKIFETLKVDININDNYFYTFNGSGLNFSSSTGSTAYNRSLKGPIVNVHNNVIIMNEISSIDNLYTKNLNSPLILLEKDVISLKVPLENVIVGGDSNYEILKEEKNDIIIKLSNDKIIFAHFNNFDYYSKLEKCFIRKD